VSQPFTFSPINGNRFKEVAAVCHSDHDDTAEHVGDRAPQNASQVSTSWSRTAKNSGWSSRSRTGTTLGPHVDGVDPCGPERPVSELWNDVGFLDGRWTDTGAGSDEFAWCVAYALVDDSEAVVIAHVARVFESIDGLSHRLVRCVEVL